MEKQAANNDKSERTIQDYLSLGYLYLLVLGVVSDSILYRYLGVNIMSYSNVLDILLSPIVHLTDGLAFPMVVILLPLFSYFTLKIVRQAAEKRGKTKPGQDWINAQSLQHTWVIFSAWIIFSAYMGFGLGRGQKLKSSMEQGDLSPSHKITFQDNSAWEVRMVGNNSSYAFYVLSGQKVVSVSPIQNTIKSIEKLSSKK